MCTHMHDSVCEYSNIIICFKWYKIEKNSDYCFIYYI